MSKVTIKNIQHEAGDETWHETEVYVDEKKIGGGSYGGEPEDNSYWRDYAWVEPLIKALAVKLGADVERTKTTETEE